MPFSKNPILFAVASTIALTFGLLTTSSSVFAASERVLYSFCPSGRPCPDGSGPTTLILDASGNLYGISAGGREHRGTVFELIPSNGNWTEKVLHSFTQLSQSRGGKGPNSLVIDASGKLYGTTIHGGAYCHHTSGCGTVFELVPSNGKWTEKVLHSFNGADGSEPWGLMMDSTGNLYGTEWGGGVNTFQSAWSLTPHNGKWTESVLYKFLTSKGGSNPSGELILDAAGNLYGTTAYGGTGSGCSTGGCGIVFELIPNNGIWTEKVLHNFSRFGKDGANPSSGLIWDAAGNLYGTTIVGGVNNDNGTVFELTPSNGKWTEKILHSFTSNSNDGSEPAGNLIFDKAGNLYGTTVSGGNNQGGTLFELTPRNGVWTEKTLYSFGSGKDGVGPVSLLMDKAGNLYGTTVDGGTYGKGTVFEFKP